MFRIAISKHNLTFGHSCSDTVWMVDDNVYNKIVSRIGENSKFEQFSILFNDSISSA